MYSLILLTTTRTSLGMWPEACVLEVDAVVVAMTRFGTWTLAAAAAGTFVEAPSARACVSEGDFFSIAPASR